MVRLTASDRREKLLLAAIDVMRERGFAEATTRDVAARLGVGRGLLHHYFDSWEMLQREAFRALATEAQEDAEQALSGLGAEHRLLALIEMMLAKPGEAHVRLYADAWGKAQTDPELASIYADVVGWWRDQVEASIANGVAEGCFVCADPAASADRLSALCDGLSSHVLLARSGLAWKKAHELLLGAVRLELGATGRADRPACDGD